jgi:hypothetical protein
VLDEEEWPGLSVFRFTYKEQPSGIQSIGGLGRHRAGLDTWEKISFLVLSGNRTNYQSLNPWHSYYSDWTAAYGSSVNRKLFLCCYMSNWFSTIFVLVDLATFPLPYYVLCMGRRSQKHRNNTCSHFALYIFRHVCEIAKKKDLISSCLSVCRSVRTSIYPHTTVELLLDGFSWNLRIFRKFAEKIQV